MDWFDKLDADSMRDKVPYRARGSIFGGAPSSALKHIFSILVQPWYNSAKLITYRNRTFLIFGSLAKPCIHQAMDDQRQPPEVVQGSNGIEYIYPRILTERRKFQPSDETNPEGKERYVYMKWRPLDGLIPPPGSGDSAFWAKLKAKFTNWEAISHWAIEVRFDKIEDEAPAESPAPTWEIMSVQDTNLRLEFAYGKWEYPQLPPTDHNVNRIIVRPGRRRCGKTKLTDEEINAKGKRLPRLSRLPTY